MLAISLVSVFMVAALVFAFQFNGPISGQVVAASASISVAALGLYLQFKK